MDTEALAVVIEPEIRKSSEPPASGTSCDPIPQVTPGDVNKTHVAQGVREEKESSVVYFNEQQCGQIMTYLKTQRQEGRFCDVVLYVQDRQYLAHRCVLSANSAYFDAALGGPRFTPASAVEQITLTSGSAKVVEAVLDYMYTGHLTISLQTVDELILTSNKLGMEDIKQCCENHLSKTLDISNWLQIQAIAREHNLVDVSKAVMDYVIENFGVIVQGKELLELENSDFEAVLKGCNPENDSDIESYLLQGIFKWVKHNVANRIEKYPELLKFVNVGNLSTTNITKALENEDLKDIAGLATTKELIDLVTAREQLKQEEALAQARAKELEEQAALLKKAVSVVTEDTGPAGIEGGDDNDNDDDEDNDGGDDVGDAEMEPRTHDVAIGGDISGLDSKSVILPPGGATSQDIVADFPQPGDDATQEDMVEESEAVTETTDQESSISRRTRQRKSANPVKISQKSRTTKKKKVPTATLR